MNETCGRERSSAIERSTNETSSSGGPADPQRKVGIEIEFAGLSVDSAAALVADTIEGEVGERGSQSFEVSSALGTFKVELDTRLADRGQHGQSLKGDLSGLLGEITSVLVPVEITMPPIAVGHLALADELIRRLREAGARGTESFIAYGFGLHLNPAVQDRGAEALLAVLRAFALGYAKLENTIDVDLTRRLLRFAQPYPEAYVRLITAKDYAPDLAALIADYLEHNSSRDRALDMLPLFAELAPDALRTLQATKPVQARPTFHYRLPNSSLDCAEWTVALEWRRWLAVEQLAAAPERLTEACDAFQRSGMDARGRDWLRRSSTWFHL